MITSGYYMATIPDKCRVILTSRQQMVEVVFASPFPLSHPILLVFSFTPFKIDQNKKIKTVQ